MPMVDMATAGTATVELTIPIESGEILTKTLDGCFVKKDANLETFVDKRIDPSADRNTFKNSEYFFYSPVNNFQGKVTKAVISYEEISKKWFTKVQKTKTCTVEKPLVITFDGHFFLCCDSRSKDLNKSKFLEEYSKEVRVNQTLDPSKSFYGLGIESYSDYKYLKFISFNMRQCPSQSNIYEIDKFNKKGESVLNKLNEAGPLLLNNNKTIVGCYRKSNHNCRIKMFGNSQDTPPPATGAGEAAGTPPPATGAGEAAGTPTPATGAGAGQAAGTPPPATGAGEAAGTPPPATGAGEAAGTPTPATGAGAGQAAGTPPPATGAGEAAGTPPPATGAGEAAGTPTPATGAGEAAGTPPPATGAGEAAGTPLPATGAGEAAGTPTPATGAGEGAGTPTPATGAGEAAGTPTPATGAGEAAGIPTPATGAGEAAGTPTPATGAGEAAGTPTPATGAGEAAGTPTSATGAGEAAGTPTPATGAGEAAGTPTPATGAGAGQADTPNPPGDNRPSDVHGDQTDRNSDNPDGIHVGVEQQVYLRDFFERDVENIKDLARFLDRRSLVIKNYEHLADLLGAPPFIKAKCKCNTEHSPTLDLLQLSEVSTLSVNALVENLRAIKQNYEADKIEMTISEDQRERLSVKEAINNYGELFEGVTSRLDAKTIYNWMKLGRKLKFQTEELDQIGLGCNPAERLLEDYVYPTLEAEKLTVGRFRQLITKIQRPTILKLLQETEEDSLCIKDVIPPHSEKMLKLCLELNTKNVGLKNWRHLAYEWGIDHKIYSQFEPNQKTSPTATEILLKEWLVSEHPRFTVNALCNLLGRIDRNDAKTFLEGKLQEYS